jgi:hypothetical protein
VTDDHSCPPVSDETPPGPSRETWLVQTARGEMRSAAFGAMAPGEATC